MAGIPQDGCCGIPPLMQTSNVFPAVTILYLCPNRCFFKLLAGSSFYPDPFKLVLVRVLAIVVIVILFRRDFLGNRDDLQYRYLIFLHSALLSPHEQQ